MTLVPYAGPQVRGVDGPSYRVGPICCNPGCRKEAVHPHHIFRRTDQRLGGAYAWIEIKGAAYQNLTGICWRCHNDITGGIGGHKAAIKILGDDYDWTWWWCAVSHEVVDGVEMETSKPLAPIEPQPLTPEEFANSRVPPQESEACPTCGHVKRARPAIGQPGRARKSWTIKVPADAENGAEILDTLVDDLAILLDVEPNQTGRYYVLVPTLYFAHQDKRGFADSIKGVGG